MVCTDRQLTEAQRAAAFEQNRNAGALKAIRPFTGEATPENLVDYLNREVYPVLRQARSAVNEIFRQVTDNAPSGNPLGYFFSASLAGDPAVGRLALDNATQENATTIRVNQQNSILRDVTTWLDVMAGSSTAPLGVVTLTAASDPSRYIRWDLNTMTDQGSYWDLGVTVVESSHPNPFVPDGSVVLAFIPGVASTGTTVGPGSITPIADETFLGNVSGVVAPPSAIALSTLAGTGLTWDAAGNNFDVTAPFVPQGWDDVLAVDPTSGANNPIVSAGRFMQFGAVGPSSFSAQIRSGDSPFIIHGGATVFTIGTTLVQSTATAGGFGANGSTTATMTAGSGTATVASTSGAVALTAGTFARVTTGGTERLEIEATGGWQLGGLVGSAGQYMRSAGAGASPAWATIAVGELGTIAAESFLGNFTAGVAAPAALAGSTVAGAGLTYTAGGTLAVGAGTNVTVNANDVAVTNFPLTGLATQAANTIIANVTAGVAAPTAVAVAADSVLARVGGNLVSHPWATLAGTFLSYSAGVMDWIGLDVRANSGALVGTRTRLNFIGTSPIGVAAADDGVGNEVDVTISVSAIPLSSLATQAAETFLGNFTAGVTTPTAVAGSTVAGAGLTYTTGGILAVGAGTHITSNANDVAVNVATLLAAIDSTSIVVNASTLETAAVTGAIAIAQNGTSSLFSGILNNAAATTDRANLNFVGFTFADDAGNNRIVITAPSASIADADYGDITVSGSGAVWTVDANINKTWTGVHAFNGSTFAVGASSTVAIAGSGNTSLTTSSGGLNVENLGGGVIDIETASGDITIQAGTGLLLNGTDGSILQAKATPDTVHGAGQVKLNADTNIRLLTANVERLEIEVDGAWQLGGNTGTAGEVITSAGSAAPPEWLAAPTLLQVSSAFAADASITITPPAAATWFEVELQGGGGGGGGADAETDGEACAGGGGGEGEYCKRIYTIVSGNITGAIGGGGAGGLDTGASGTGGTNSSVTYNALSSTCSGGGGGGGVSSGSGEAATTDMEVVTGGQGGAVGTTTTDTFFRGGEGGENGVMYSNGATETNAAASGGKGGGAGGRGATVNNVAAAVAGEGARGPGGGGGGGARIVSATAVATGAAGGAGAAGFMVVRFYSGSVPTRNAIT